MTAPSLTNLDIREGMPQFTKEKAIAIAESEGWKALSDRNLVMLQLYQKKLFMPFSTYHEKIEAVMGRPVFTHEFAFPQHLIDELLGRKGKSSMGDVIDLLPADKVVIVST